MLDLQAQTG